MRIDLGRTYLEEFVRWPQFCVVVLLVGSLEEKSHVPCVGRPGDFPGVVLKVHIGGIEAVHQVSERTV